MRRLPAGHFLGKAIKSTEIENARFTESIYSSGQQLSAHGHELPHVGLIVRGAYEESVGPKSFTILPGSLTFYHPEQAHEETFLSAGTHFLIEIRPAESWFTDTMMPLFSPDRVSFGSDLTVAWRLYQEFKAPDSVSPIAMEALTLELLVESFRNNLSGREGRRPVWIDSVLEILKSCFSESPRLSEIAAQVGIHPVHLAKTFRHFEGMTIGEYLRRLRVSFAREKLSQTSDPLSQIALEAGFSDQTHFTKVFKRLTGVTPARFRNLTRS